jgi:hypothetical protein
MVLADHEYVHQGRRKKKLGNDLDRRAEAIAEIVAHLCLDAPQSGVQDERPAIVQHLGEMLRTGDYRDPGESFTVHAEVCNAIDEAALGWISKKKR